MAEKIFGKDIATIKGKTTRRKPLPVSPSYVDIPKELVIKQKHTTLAIDDMTVNSLVFLTTISLNLYYRTAHYLPHANAPYHFDALNDVIKVYHQAGFLVCEIRADSAFRKVLPTIMDKYMVP